MPSYLCKPRRFATRQVTVVVSWNLCAWVYRLPYQNQMLLPRLSLIGSFAFHGTISARRICAAFRGGPGSWPLLRLHGASRLTSFSSSSTVLSTKKMSAADHQQPQQPQTTKVVPGVQDLCDRYDGFILDQFGVLHGELRAEVTYV